MPLFLKEQGTVKAKIYFHFNLIVIPGDCEAEKECLSFHYRKLNNSDTFFRPPPLFPR